MNEPVYSKIQGGADRSLKKLLRIKQADGKKKDLKPERVGLREDRVQTIKDSPFDLVILL
jgi:hypothetical protein